MIIPPYLKPGDKVAIVAASRKVDHEELAPAIAILQEWGLVPVPGRHLYSSHHQWAGTHAERAADLQGALNDDQIKAVFFARGGNGIIHLVDRVDFSPLKAQAKWLIGYSDVTILHAHLHAMGMASLHAAMLTVYSKNAETVESIRKQLFGEAIRYDFKAHALNRPGEATAVITGGNLSLLHTLTGTKEDLYAKGKILFIEDLDENLHHLDRMMMHLKRTGKLAQLAGLVVGGLNDMKDDPIPFGLSPEEIVWQTVKEYQYPVCFGFPAGHLERNLALKLGASVNLKIGPEECSLAFL